MLQNLMVQHSGRWGLERTDGLLRLFVAGGPHGASLVLADNLLFSCARVWGWAVFDPFAVCGHGHHLKLFKSPQGTDRACAFWRGTGHGAPWTCRFVDLHRAHCAEQEDA